MSLTTRLRLHACRLVELAAQIRDGDWSERIATSVDLEAGELGELADFLDGKQVSTKKNAGPGRGPKPEGRSHKAPAAFISDACRRRRAA